MINIAWNMRVKIKAMHLERETAAVEASWEKDVTGMRPEANRNPRFRGNARVA